MGCVINSEKRADVLKYSMDGPKVETRKLGIHLYTKARLSHPPIMTSIHLKIAKLNEING